VQDFIVDPLTRVTDLQRQLLQVARGSVPKASIKGIGSAIFLRTTWDWCSVGPKSITREVTFAAHCAISEMARLKAYRTNIVMKTSAAHLRQTIAQALGPLTDGITRDGRVIYEWSFWDGLKAKDISTVATVDATAAEQRQLALRYAHEPLEHLQEMRHIIKTIEDSRVSTIAGLKGGPLEHNVAVACNSLLQVRHRSSHYILFHANCPCRLWRQTQDGSAGGASRVTMNRMIRQAILATHNGMSHFAEMLETLFMNTVCKFPFSHLADLHLHIFSSVPIAGQPPGASTAVQGTGKGKGKGKGKEVAQAVSPAHASIVDVDATDRIRMYLFSINVALITNIKILSNCSRIV
jgi:hypothetical protein